jgi:hypothetical protein
MKVPHVEEPKRTPLPFWRSQQVYVSTMHSLKQRLDWINAHS